MLTWNSSMGQWASVLLQAVVGGGRGDYLAHAPLQQSHRGGGTWDGGAEPAKGRQWLPEPGVGRVAHGVPARVDRLKALGNAVVPQVVEMIGRAILAAGQAP